eukprot:CAMPEP_0172708180 /NCGR_PEP_ID=MMETSP1074-20121228/50404_1 /TAXON_ID=2916 /ORGANISM="Ceratium fusus, Strain PA161109" /LENGTH=34 /DNA_ID= /DNA_START= /DNA_END= /DNA_ORIENTATION=
MRWGCNASYSSTLLQTENHLPEAASDIRINIIES